MRSVTYSPILKKDKARMIGRGKNIEKFIETVSILVIKGNLPIQYRAHKLRGEYEGYWECHIEHDWLLIYEISDEEVFLVRTGTHSDLFE